MAETPSSASWRSLSSAPDNWVTHRQMLDGVWGTGYERDVHLLRMTVRNLRLKLDAAAPGESFVATEYGLGYRLVGTRPSSES